VAIPDTVLSCPLKVIPLVEGRLGSTNVPVVLDTGAMQSAIDAKLAERLELATSAYVFPRRFSLIGGMQSARRYARVDGFELGGIRIDELELPLLDLEKGTGLSGGAMVIGCEVLRRCRVLFEARSQTIRILDAGSSQTLESRLQELRPDDTWTSLPVRWEAGRPLVNIGMDGRKDAQVLLDTGAIQTAFDPELAREWRLPSMHGSENLVFVDGLRIGPWRARFVAQIASADLGTRFGFEVMGSFVFAWDGPGNRVLIANPKAGEPDSVDAGMMIEQVLRDMGLEPVRERR
jgi:predicted aspartyl protease